MCVCVCVSTAPTIRSQVYFDSKTKKVGRRYDIIVTVSYSLTRSPSLQVQCQFKRARGHAVLHLHFMTDFDEVFAEDDDEDW